MSTSPRLRVAIAYVAANFLIIIILVLTANRLPSGAGLGGLVLALFLQKNCPDVTFNVYEAAHQLGEIGDRNIILWADHRAEEEANLINSTGSLVLDYVGSVMSVCMCTAFPQQ